MSTFPGGFVPVAPPADGLRLAFVAARRRRSRKAGAAGTAGLLAAVALFASTGGTGDRALMQEPLPPSSTTGLGIVEGAGEATAAPTSTAAPAPVDLQSPDPNAHLAVGQARSTGRNGTTTVEQPQQSTGGSSHGVRAQSTKPVSGPMTRSASLGYPNDLICPARKQQERQRGLCSDIYVTNSAQGTMTVTAEICNAGTATDLLSFPTARELDLTVRQGTREVWRWSTGRHFAATPHEITIGTQECVMWSTEWSLVDSKGARVKAGDYTIVAAFEAEELAVADRHPSYNFSV
jgi:hypothetical protein